MTCIHCGCTGDRACILAGGIPCSWSTEKPLEVTNDRGPVCTNPRCLEKQRLNFPAEGWQHALNAAKYSSGDTFGWWQDGTLWSGIVEETDHRGLRVRVRDVLPGMITP